ncbi:hypothetical protein TREMEDRAFT_74665 [Tremella mesenterica DSM 1558]|uniref:uncharacterized protein n=1 Tax=Tremella mesenterica (strain ATCC 24925 / CBS 8224 / DSM 1558 / NBRC 9311 / NRRL Y-6157 / RJB 2259-6 / UBC 559-6) TaxID=578456 RepID=UPI00032D1576|nr:uncharacterized protein TREMEDRAFT_74665 [Tremella mesenterica DSM 1558]EIW66698.1 hypothetical protein TREMEDRAFT_74665 [Tremella mesenterica DSM 1558]
MPDLLRAASLYKKKHPSESFASISLRYNVPKTTLYNRYEGVHSRRGVNVARALSIAQEAKLVLKINNYADRGTLLTPQLVRELAEAAAGRAFKTSGGQSTDKESLVFTTIGPNSEHITTIACIGIDIYAPQVPPMIIYQGKGQVLPAWTRVREPDVVQKGMVTLSGWSNSYICLKWLTDVFDSATCDHVPSGCRHLLFLDGADPHVKVEFLEACWARNIVIIIFPAGMTGEFQPLDVDFFNHVKHIFFNQMDAYQRGSSLSRVAKGMFWGWHQIKAAWRKAGLWPLDADVMGAVDPPIPQGPTTPPPHGSSLSPDLETPQNHQRLRKYSSLIRQGILSPTRAFEKARKKLEESLAESAFKDREIADMQAAMQLDKEA